MPSPLLPYFVQVDIMLLCAVILIGINELKNENFKARNREIDCINNAEFRYRNQVNGVPFYADS